MKLLITKFSPFPCHLVPLKPKYSPQHPQSTFLPQCWRPGFTPIQNNRPSTSFISPSLLEICSMQSRTPSSIWAYLRSTLQPAASLFPWIMSTEWPLQTTCLVTLPIGLAWPSKPL
jgi:hypothetical protein